ncbi:uncharacterized protein [Temnothorax nylanderi]|uniref:uncharacterized protein n=1 Tax=Temnothorax nylanderi TaxID=102681 RepID=UPI003A84C98C
MECRETIIIEKEAIEKIVEGKVLEMIKEFKEDSKRKVEEIKELKEEVERLKRKVYRMEQSTGKRKRDDSEGRKGKFYKRKWWAEEYERNDDEKRKKNVILRIEKERWVGKESNWEKVKELFSEGLKVKVEVKEVSVIGQRRDWVTVLIKMGNEEDKWKVLDARRKEGSKLRVKMDEDKSVETRVREREEKERRKERREEESGRPKRTAEDEIAKRVEENLLMDSDEDEADRKKRE